MDWQNMDEYKISIYYIQLEDSSSSVKIMDNSLDDEDIEICGAIAKYD